MDKKISTVSGDIAPEELGFTTMHEHILADIYLLRREVMQYKANVPDQMLKLCNENMAMLRSGLSTFSDECGLENDIGFAVAELREFKKMGGGAVCDASPMGMRAPADQLREAARQSGIHLVTCTGIYYKNARPEEFLGKDEAYMYEFFRREVEEGIDGSGVKPGFLKSAVQTVNADGSIEASELAAICAQARLSKETGLSVHVHHGPGLPEDTISQVVKVMVDDMGMEPGRLLMLHQDQYLRRNSDNDAYLSNPELGRNVEIGYLERILDRGVNISFDNWGTSVSTMPDDYDRLKALIMLLQKGYGSQIVCGHDHAGKATGKTTGGYGYCRFAEMLGQLQKFGLAGEIQKIAVENPARILAY